MPGPPSITSSDSSGGGAPLHSMSSSSSEASDDDFTPRPHRTKDILKRHSQQSEPLPDTESTPTQKSMNSRRPFMPGNKMSNHQQRPQPPNFHGQPMNFPPGPGAPIHNNQAGPSGHSQSPWPHTRPITPQREYVKQAFAQQRHIVAQEQQAVKEHEGSLLQASNSFGNTVKDQKPALRSTTPVDPTIGPGHPNFPRRVSIDGRASRVGHRDGPHPSSCPMDQSSHGQNPIHGPHDHPSFRMNERPPNFPGPPHPQPRDNGHNGPNGPGPRPYPGNMRPPGIRPGPLGPSPRDQVSDLLLYPSSIIQCLICDIISRRSTRDSATWNLVSAS